MLSGFSTAVRGAEEPPPVRGRQDPRQHPDAGIDDFLLAVDSEVASVVAVADSAVSLSGFSSQPVVPSASSSQAAAARRPALRAQSSGLVSQPGSFSSLATTVPLQQPDGSRGAGSGNPPTGGPPPPARAAPQPLRQPPATVRPSVKRQATLTQFGLVQEETVDPYADTTATFLERTVTPEKERAARAQRKPQGPIVSEEVANSIDELKSALERVKRKLDRSREAEARLGDELKAREARAAEVQREQQRAEIERIKALERAAEKTKKQKAKQKALKGRRAVVGALEEDEGEGGTADVLDEDLDAGEADEVEHRVGLSLLAHRLRTACRRFYRGLVRSAGSTFHWLLGEDVRWIQSRFGSSVAVYFVYSEYIVNLAVVNLILWSAFHAASLAQHVAGAAPPTPSLLSGPMAALPPEVFRYSATGGDPYGAYAHVSLLYGLSVMLYMAWYSVAALHRMSTEAQMKASRDIYAPKKNILFAQNVTPRTADERHDERVMAADAKCWCWVLGADAGCWCWC